MTESNLNIDDIISLGETVMKNATTGVWMKGDTTHDTVSLQANGKTYQIGSFRHANDAALVDYAHENVPHLIAEIKRLRLLVPSS